jgi:hypothetical protein
MVDLTIEALRELAKTLRNPEDALRRLEALAKIACISDKTGLKFL